jgi:hypothetical protein
MDEEQKSLKLAELMKWFIFESQHGDYRIQKTGDVLRTETLEPYCKDSNTGLAQFAAILLKFPEMMEEYCQGIKGHGFMRWSESDKDFVWLPPTQANILDEILRMNGVDI